MSRGISKYNMGVGVGREKVNVRNSEMTLQIGKSQLAERKNQEIFHLR